MKGTIKKIFCYVLLVPVVFGAVFGAWLFIYAKTPFAP